MTTVSTDRREFPASAIPSAPIGSLFMACLLGAMIAVFCAIVARETRDPMLLSVVFVLTLATYFAMMVAGVPAYITALFGSFFYWLQQREMTREPDEEGHRAIMTAIMMCGYMTAMPVMDMLYNHDNILAGLTRQYVRVEVMFVVAGAASFVTLLLLDAKNSKRWSAREQKN